MLEREAVRDKYKFWERSLGAPRTCYGVKAAQNGISIWLASSIKISKCKIFCSKLRNEVLSDYINSNPFMRMGNIIGLLIRFYLPRTAQKFSLLGNYGQWIFKN